MANMSYCRFYNTNMDLGDCLEALEDGAELSTDEFIACKNMFKKFIDFVVMKESSRTKMENLMIDWKNFLMD